MSGSEKSSENWRRWVPFGVLEPHKPRHFREMARVAWENRDNLGYAWRILNHGVCDGCSLGPRGLRDDVIEGTHLCLTRLKLLRLNTMPSMAEGAADDMGRLRAMTNTELQALGRVPWPMIYRRGDRGFRRASWDEALGFIAERFRATSPDRTAYFATSRGLTNEAYYVFQKLARLAGTNNVDLCARLCHAPTVDGLSRTLGVSAPTCQLSDFIGTDLVILFGTDLANNQPVTTKYLHHARKQGTRILVVNPYREPALERYWIPSVPSSALFGTKLMDDFFPVRVGGDVAFINGVLKHLAATGGFDTAFIDAHCAGFEELIAELDRQDWEDLEEASGAARADMVRFAETYARARSAVLCYSMGLTQHANGVDNVCAVVNLALARGMIGRPKAGIMPIRGHSGVQGGGEIGVAPTKFPGGRPLNADTAAHFADLWGAPVPDRPGLSTPEALAAAARGEIDILYNIGGNLLETMPDRAAMFDTFARIGLRIHQDIVFNTSTLCEPGEAVVVLPAQTRYEHAGGVTSTSTERRIRFSPEVPGPRPAEARAEWEIPALLGRRIVDGGERFFGWTGTQAIREEIARVMPMYRGIETLRKEGDWIQWGGERLLEGGVCPNMPEGRGRFTPLRARPKRPPEGMFALATRRGKQFNSMTHGARDPLTGATGRHDVIVSEEDARRLGIRQGQRIRLSSQTGTMDARAHLGPVRSGTVQAFWPEANVLIPQIYDPISHVPDYNAFVKIEAIETPHPEGGHGR
jgi:molybdopterin-dependent oxidoreductase alpha subunit